MLSSLSGGANCAVVIPLHLSLCSNVMTVVEWTLPSEAQENDEESQ